jgi:hypothetical protein
MRSKVKKVKHNYHYFNPTFVRGAYKKALLIIDSCKNEFHLKATKKYISNYLMLQSNEIGFKQYETDTFLLNSFDRLVNKFEKKKREIGYDEL